MARLAATKEYAFLKILHEHDFPVPQPVDQNRHMLIMEWVDGTPLYQVQDVENPGDLYSKLMDLIVRLANYGLIHGDFNEFNLLLTDDGEPILIDFPQMISTSHKNAEMYFNRDVVCIREFFRKRFQYESHVYPKFTRDVHSLDFRLDVQVSASGFSKKEQVDFEKLQDDLLNLDLSQSESVSEDEDESVSVSDHQEENEENDEDENQDEIKEIKENEEIKENKENENQDLQENENKTFVPHRDSKIQSTSISYEQIQKRVAKTVKKSGQFHHSRNQTKGKRNTRDSIKMGLNF